MYTTSFLFGVLVVVGWYQTAQAYAATSSVQLLLDTLNFENCEASLEKRVLCLKLGKYRTFDGTCNNLCNITIGSTLTPHDRFGGTAYEPGFQPRQFSTFPSTKPIPLINARQASRKVFNNDEDQGNFTHVTMTWGQFLDHDVTLTEFTVGVNPQTDCGGSFEPCPSRVEKPNCIGVDITQGNNLISFPNVKCTPLSRSEQNEDGQQINEVTSYIDASMVYGSDIGTANSLRLFKKGLLLVDPFVRPEELPVLPAAESAGGEAGFCRSFDTTIVPCFRAGDPRVNENHALMAMHALWVREHNRIAKRLYILNPSWCDEKLYQEARRIVGAMIQHITYNEWLPALIPSRSLRRDGGIELEAPGTFFDGYDPFTRAVMFNEVSTAAFRMGHTLIRENFTLATGPRFNDRVGESPVDFFDPAPLSDLDFGVNPYTGFYLGLVLERAFDFDANIAKSVTERLIIPGPGDGLPGDLAAINIQRGRDHGIPGYTQFLKLCDGPDVTGSNFDVLTDIPRIQRALLDSAYLTVEDVDLFPGLLSERPQEGSELGRTTTCMLLAQFKRLRKGDRHWYERDDDCIGFTMEQLTEIRKSSLARVICDNSDDVANIQPKVFLRRINGGPNDDVSCFDVSYVNLEVFKEGPRYSDGTIHASYRWDTLTDVPV